MKTLRILTLVLLAAFSFSSCSKEEDEPYHEGLDDRYVLEAELDGNAVVLQEGKDGYSSFGSAGKTSGTGFCLDAASMIIGRYSELSKANTKLKNAFQVTLQRHATTCSANDSYMRGLYRVGEYPFAKDTNDPNATGVVILYTDAHGIDWATNKGSQDQTASRFEVTQHQAIKSKIYQFETEAVFNCTLYNDAGEAMVLTNGRIMARSVPYPSKYQ
ncbi:hypothetical protein [Pontibacter roseus]|uniref:hypothetical protein n=1 Tax=Pontibacter roseus TaxID=336989 RepID=UPI00038295E9|nr:hypothetical protein [Pontibacter roseus]